MKLEPVQRTMSLNKKKWVQWLCAIQIGGMVGKSIFFLKTLSSSLMDANPGQGVLQLKTYVPGLHGGH